MILIINTGSTSLKYKLFSPDLKEIKVGSFADVADRKSAFKQMLREIGDLSEIKVVGHRVVHGGDEFTEPTEIDDDVLLRLEKYNSFAPLHNPYNLGGIKMAMDYLSGVKNVACFDTAFYKTLPDKAKFYAIPSEYAEKYGLKKFGFHGLSHEYVAQVAAEKLGKKLSSLKIISCHLGGGASVTAVDGGVAVDTSMGFTPLEGLVMMTRGGDIDPGVVLELVNINNGDAKKVAEILNYESGIKGICGIGDFKELLKKKSLSSDAKLAFDMFVYRLQKYIGAYYAALGGKLDALIFTGAIGFGSKETCDAITDNLKFLNKTAIMQIPTDEELEIAKKITNYELRITN